MKIFICASKHNYVHIPELKSSLEEIWHIITLPNSYDVPFLEYKIRDKSAKEHIKWKQSMLRLQSEKVWDNDAILVLNFDKNWMKNYIWWATFLEVYEGFRCTKVPGCVDDLRRKISQVRNIIDKQDSVPKVSRISALE